MFQGKVTHLTTGEPLAGILMSDGRNCVRTDKKGRYRLPGWERCRLVYACVLTERHDDWFRPASKKRIDFAILPAKDEKKGSRFLHFSDTEIATRPNVTWLPFVQNAVKKTGADFVMNTGDLSSESGLTRTKFYLNRETAGVPVRYAIGNHDYMPGEYGEREYERQYGPTWYSFDQGGTHYAVLSIGKSKLYASGYEKEDQWIWLENDLAASGAKKFVIFKHDRCSDPEHFVETAGEKTVDCKPLGLRAWFCGHAHYNYAHQRNGVFSICTARPDDGGIDSSEACVRFAKIDEKKIASRLIYNAPPAAKGDPFLWRTALEGRVSRGAPVTDGKRIFVATFDDGFPKKCGVYALDPRSGAILWHHPTPDGVKGALALLDGVLYAQDTAGTLYALSAETGEEIFSRRDYSRAYTRTGVLAANGKIYAGSPILTLAYEAKTGRLLWKTEPDPRSDAGPARSLWDPARRQIILSAQWRGLLALDADTGEVKWFNQTTPVRFRTATPLLAGNSIYTTGRSGALIEVDPDTGEYRKTEPMKANGETGGQPLLWNGVLYIPTGNRGVLAADPDTFAVLRAFPAGPSRIFTVPYLRGPQQTVESSPVEADGLLVFAGADGVIYRYTPEGKLVQKTDVGAAVTADLLLTENAIVAADFAGRVTAYPRKINGEN